MSTAYDPVARPTYTGAGLMPDERLDRPASGPALADEVPVFGTPIYARTAKKRPGLPIPAIAVGVGAAALLAAAGYFMMQPRDELFAEQTATAPAAAPPVTEIAATTPPPAAVPAVAEPAPVATRVSEQPTVREARTPVRAARARPAPVADSPETWASDTSGRMPDAPIPYSALAQTPAAAPAVAAPPVTLSAPSPEAAPPAPAPAPADSSVPAAQTPAPESVEEPTP